MNDHSAFIAEIQKNEEDLDIRLVYADWLEEQGSAKHAEYLRLENEFAQLPPDADGYSQHLENLLTALPNVHWDWLDQVGHRFDVRFDSCGNRKLDAVKFMRTVIQSSLMVCKELAELRTSWTLLRKIPFHVAFAIYDRPEQNGDRSPELTLVGSTTNDCPTATEALSNYRSRYSKLFGVRPKVESILSLLTPDRRDHYLSLTFSAEVWDRNFTRLYQNRFRRGPIGTWRMDGFGQNVDYEFADDQTGRIVLWETEQPLATAILPFRWTCLDDFAIEITPAGNQPQEEGWFEGVSFGTLEYEIRVERGAKGRRVEMVSDRSVTPNRFWWSPLPVVLRMN